MSTAKTLEWLRSMEHPDGGIRAWPEYKAYPEVTGYLIPTLKRNGEKEYAERLGDWLESIQNLDGSWNGLEGGPAVFDTAAIIEGLRALGRDTSKADAYLWRSTLEDGTLPAGPTEGRRLYTMRATAIGDNRTGAEWWAEHLHEFTHERSHYMAYALEGLWWCGFHDLVKSCLEEVKCPTPWMWAGSGGVDYCATAQFGLLKACADMDFQPHLAFLRNVQRIDGSFPMPFSWTAKYYLDFEHAVRP